ncbi:MAG: hypothetical protein EHM61_04050 [Acidobacteria bacterium]|nr:MAG: hypothetical protein EHM61_04050 [Acidobacteriota bacterium]
MNGILPYLLALIVLVVAASVFLAYRRNRNWRQFATKYRFQYRQNALLRNPRVVGEIQGRSFRLRKAETSSDTGLLGVELVEMSMGLLGRLPKGLEITKSATSLADEISAPSIKTGDQEFDDAAFVKGNDSAVVLDYLTLPRRLAILELFAWDTADWAGIRDNQVVLIERRMVSDAQHLEERFQFLFDVARRLDR